MRMWICLLLVILRFSCNTEVKYGGPVWRWRIAEHKGTYKIIPCFAKPVADIQIKGIINKVINEELPFYDSVYVTLLPHRPADQIYSVTDNPTYILMRLWSKRKPTTTIPNILYDPHGDFLIFMMREYR